MLLVPKTESLVDRFFTDLWGDTEDFNPKADIVEKKGNYEIDLHLPGIKKEDVNIEVKNDILTVSGERKKETTEEKDGYSHYESSYGTFSRSWYVDKTQAGNIKADYKDGILKLTLPKIKKEENVKKIELK
ncbi:Hsp20/alpha crystallin family protein [Spirochaetota bacterium]